MLILSAVLLFKHTTVLFLACRMTAIYMASIPPTAAFSEEMTSGRS